MNVIQNVKYFTHIKQTFAHFEKGLERKTNICLTEIIISQRDISLIQRIKIDQISKYLPYKYIHHTPRQ